jgi:hypothetical protein
VELENIFPIGPTSQYLVLILCTEGKPTCHRCQKFGVKCDGYVRPRKAPPIVKSTRKVLLPKSSIKILLPTFGFENEVERKYFAQFQEKTALEIAPYFDSETWRRLVLQTCQVPAIRHAIIAIGALDKTYMTSRTENDSNLDLSEDADSPNVHRRIALNHYTKAIRSMRESVEHGKQDLRTTLITCLVIACFEAFHGNHPFANAQILTGMSLIYEWKATFSNEIPMGFKSPKPDIVEDDLVQTFGRLEFQTCEYVGMYNRPTATLERQAALRAAGTNVLRKSHIICYFPRWKPSAWGLSYELIKFLSFAFWDRRNAVPGRSDALEYLSMLLC